MWIVFGTQTKTERVPNGLRVRRECERCTEEADFFERRVVSTFNLYFLPVFDYRRERVMACGACGALFRTDEHGEPDLVTSRGWEKALLDAGERAHSALEGAFQSVAPSGFGAMRRAASAVESFVRGAPEPEPERFERDEPEIEDPEKAALLRRFAELEKKMAEKK